eukprot:5926351-Prymnesium_polylepis.1
MPCGHPVKETRVLQVVSHDDTRNDEDELPAEDWLCRKCHAGHPPEDIEKIRVIRPRLKQPAQAIPEPTGAGSAGSAGTSAQQPGTAEPSQAAETVFPAKDKRTLAFEAARPWVEWPAEQQSLLAEIQTFGEKALEEQIRLKDAVLDLPAVSRLLEKPELSALRERLRGIRAEHVAEDGLKRRELQRLLAKWGNLGCRNASIVQFNDVLTACVACNTAPYFLGGGESAKAAMFYMVQWWHSNSRHTMLYLSSPLTTAQVKYITKDSVALNASLAVLYDARMHIDLYPSAADDIGTAERTARHFMQRVLNRTNMELSDTQEAMMLLGNAAHGSSESFVHVNLWSAVTAARGAQEVSLANNEQKEAPAL